MNARYYDPVLGQFISPDTLVPDAGLLVDYNRYGYARGNPLKFSDPSGHCATLSSGEPDWNDGECWTLALTIANMWADTDYWQKRLGDIEVWNGIAHSGVETDFFAYELDLFLNSDAGKSWLKPDDTVRIDNWNDDPIMLWFDDYCYKQGHDCTGILLDGIGAGGAAAVAIACIPGFAVCGTVAAVGGGIGIVSGGVGVAWTANQVYQGNATKEDLIVSTTTFVIGSVGPVGRVIKPVTSSVIGLGTSAIQLAWDFWGVESNNRRYGFQP